MTRHKQRQSLRVLTLRKIPPEIAREIEKQAAETGTSLSKAVLRLVARGAGLDRVQTKRAVHHDLDDLAGTWSDADAAEFERNVRQQRRIVVH